MPDRIKAKRPKPNGAWTLHFVGGSLEAHERWWVGDCPITWANSKSGVQESYVLKSRDDVEKLAVYELVTGADQYEMDRPGAGYV